MTETPNARAARSTYLLDGRRVTISDLIYGGLLEVGTTLQFTRPRIGETHTAVVTDAGGLLLEDGREFRSPSRAAGVAADGSIDGWHVWVARSSGRSLDSLRTELLDQVANYSNEEVDRSTSEASLPQRRHERLKEARNRADANDSMELSVRDLIALWGSKGRGQRISQRIEADLANHGLATSPSFRKVTLDATVHLVNASSNEAESSGAQEFDTDEVEELDAGMTVGNLPSALGGVVSVTPNASFEEAITLMLLNDYSQLAVLSGKHQLRGTITWKSIAQARHANPSAIFSDAIIGAEVVPYHRELVDVLDTLKTEDYIFVQDENGAIAGIVTTADVVQVYGELATPFLLIGELDQLLRRVIIRTFSLDEVTSLCDSDGSRELRSFDNLGMGDYQRVLANRDRWEKLDWPLDRVAFTNRLDKLRELRNDVMHFNPDPVPTDAVDMLRNFLRLLRKYGD